MNMDTGANDHLEEIYEWIDQIKLSRPKKNIARDFSDGGNDQEHLHLFFHTIPLLGSLTDLSIRPRTFTISFMLNRKTIDRDDKIAVLMAELLKRYYPKHVDVHNYVAGNSIAKKLDNWCTLNRKVLSKIDMKLRKELINQLASSQPGVIEKVLADLRVKILKDCNADRVSLYSDHEDDKGEAVKSVLNPDEVTNKSVSRHVFVRLKQELQEKNDKISTLQHKISHMESIMKLKDQRIDDLTLQITKQSQERDISPRPHVISKLCGTKL